MHEFVIATDCGWVYRPNWTDIFTHDFQKAHRFYTDSNGGHNDKELRPTIRALRTENIGFQVLELVDINA